MLNYCEDQDWSTLFMAKGWK